MQTQQEDQSTSIDSLFYTIGFVSCFALTVFDFYTSFTGIRGFSLPGATEVWRTYLPFVLSGVAITFVACSSTITEKFFGQPSPKTIMLLICFVVSIIYDLVSSFFGTIMGITASSTVREAFEKAGQEHIILSVVAAFLMMLGSFLLSKFYYLLKSGKGFFARMFQLGG